MFFHPRHQVRNKLHFPETTDLSSPMPVLGSPGLGHWLVSFLELRSEVSFSDVVLRPARKLFFSLSDIEFGGALSNFETSSTEWRASVLND